MILYAVDNYTCRWKMILDYFGETIDEKLCNKKCDNCLKDKSNIEMINITNILPILPWLFELVGF